MKTPGDPRPPIVTPAVAADAVLVHRGRVLLVQRGPGPYEGRWCLPGGFIQVGERAERAAERELFEETGARGRVIGLVGVYSDPRRDPRGHNIALAFRLRPTKASRPVRGGDDARDARWWPLDRLPPLAFDHAEILRDALGRSRQGGARRLSPRR